MNDLVARPLPPEPLAVLADVREPTRLSATTLIASSRCLLAAYLARHTGDPSGGPAIVGSLFHEVAAQVGFQARLLGRETFTEDEVERTALRVLSRPEEHRPLSPEHFEEVVALARRWALTAYFPVRAEQYDVEMSVRNVVAGQVLSGRIDLRTIDGTTAEIDDYKSSQKTPSQREVEEDHVQLPIYAWHVHREAPHVETFVLRERYVRSGATREVILTIDEVRRHERWLTAAATRVRNAWAVNGFEPTPGRHCRYCPNPTACPLPEWARPESISTADQARDQIAAALVESARLKTRNQMIRAYLLRDDAPEAVEVGDATARIVDVPRKELDRKAAVAAGLDLASYERTATSRRLKIDGVK